MKFAPSKTTTTFIAVSLPLEAKRQLQILQEQLARHDSKITWEIPEKLHITIAYLGKITQPEIAKVLRVTAEVMQTLRITPFVLHIQYLNYFFHQQGQSSLNIGISRNPTLENFYKILAKALNENGFSISRRRLAAHITLGRLKRLPKQQQRQLLESITETNQDWQMDFQCRQISLLSSHYQPEFRTTDYRVIAELEF